MSRFRVRRWLLAGGALALAVAPTAAWAETEAEATGAQATGGDGQSAAVSHTEASSSGGAEANAVEINGEPPSEEFGGSTDNGTESGAAFDSTEAVPGSEAAGEAHVAPWEASSNSFTGSEAEAALLRLVVGPGGQVATVSLIQTKVSATDTAGTAESDAAVLTVGGDALVVKVLHAEQTTEGDGLAYVVSVNDQQVLTNSDADGQCAVQVPGVLDLNCLVVTETTPEALATVIDAGVADDTISALVVNAQVSETEEAAAPDPDPFPSPSPSPFVPPSPAPTDPPSSLPRTGAGLGLLAAGGLGVGALGTALARLRRELD